jgi:glycosyltransferase involved in cell wall biosynthesis
MRIDHVITSIDDSTGGPARSATQLVQGLVRKKEVSAVSLHTLTSPAPIITEFNDTKANLVFNRANLMGYSKALHHTLKQSDANIFHGHGIWELPTHIMAKVGRQRKIPYVVSTRGALDSWSIKHKPYKKQIALTLYQHRDINKAACIHATSENEAKNIRRMGFNVPIAIIPNGIPLPDLNDSGTVEKLKSVLFLSRLVKNKGIEELLTAWSGLKPALQNDWTLVVVGTGKLEYVNYVKQKAKTLGIPNITFKGPMYGRF